MEAHSFLSPLKPYLEAFTEREPTRRLELLIQALTPEAEIWGPKRVFAGYVEISEKIEGFQQNWPDCRLVLASGLICFGNAGHFAKALADSKNSILASGHSVAELAPDGRISRILAFWGPAPSLPESWPRTLAAPAALSGESAA